MRKQDYRKLRGTNKEVFELYNKRKLIYLDTVKLDDYENVYVTADVNIKPKALHRMIKNTNDSIREYQIDNHDLRIIIVSYKDGFESYGQYDAISNCVYYNDVIANKEILLKENIELGHIERHEMWHFKQADDYRKRFKEISLNNYLRYLAYANKKAKKFIDSRGINKDNIGVISVYANVSYRSNRFDEVEAEIMAKKGAK